MFNVAIDDGIISENPFKKVKRLRIEERERALTPEEQSFLMVQLNHEYRRLVTVFLGTGLRHAELLALRPKDASPTEIGFGPRLPRGGSRGLFPFCRRYST